jgi:hypothetical protein
VSAARTCDCEACRKCRKRADENERSRLRAYGVWQPKLVDAEAARLHVKELVRQGASHKRIAQAAGVSDNTIDGLAWGRRNRPATVQIRRRSADAILSVTLDQTLVFVDGTGTARRIQALLALGWPSATLAAELNMSPKFISDMSRLRRTVGVRPEHAHAVTQLYDRLGMRPGPNRTTAARARRAGYVPPLAWDDNEIDDPDAQPRDPGTGRGQWNTRLPDGARLAALVNGASVKLVADKYGVEYRSVQKRLWRAGYRAVQIGAGEYSYVRRDAA